MNKILFPLIASVLLALSFSCEKQGPDGPPGPEGPPGNPGSGSTGGGGQVIAYTFERPLLWAADVWSDAGTFSLTDGIGENGDPNFFTFRLPDSVRSILAEGLILVYLDFKKPTSETFWVPLPYVAYNSPLQKDFYYLSDMWQETFRIGAKAGQPARTDDGEVRSPGYEVAGVRVIVVPANAVDELNTIENTAGRGQHIPNLTTSMLKYGLNERDFKKR